MSTTSNRQSEQSVADQVFTTALAEFQRWQRQSSSFELPPETACRGLVHQLLDQVFRRLGEIDWIISSLCDSRRASQRLKACLRLAVGQILYRRNPPPPVAVDTFVRLAGNQFSRKEAGFVNAVLRRLTREIDDWRELSSDSLPDTARLNLGSALLKQWRHHMEIEQIERLASFLQNPPPMIVRLRRPHAGNECQSSFSAECSRLLQPLPAFPWAEDEKFYLCPYPREFMDTQEFEQGMFYIQDPATALASSLLDVRKNELAADLCAAPGGKAILLHEKISPGGFILCGERDQRRLGRLRENLYMQENMAIIAADARRPPIQHAKLNAVLLDVPCSNTGVIRRRPDVRWRFSGPMLQRLLKLQKKILAGVAPFLAPSGRLVYSTCSIEPEENQRQVSSFLEKFPEFRLEEQRQLYPDDYYDGAYAALLVRK